MWPTGLVAWRRATSIASANPNQSYSACRLLRVLDVATGLVRSFAAPARTVGWVPNGLARATAVPASGAFLDARTAWSANGGWLLYQRRGELSAYQPSTGKVRSSRLLCCQYTVMVGLPSSERG